MSPTGHLFVDSLKGFLSTVVELRDKWRTEDENQAKKCGDKNFEPGQYWYRGVSDANYELKPKLYRKSGFEAVRKFSRKRSDEDEDRKSVV